MKYNIS